MLRKLAIKRLTASDLTFFAWHYRTSDVGNQAAVNLNADVLVAKLYPAIETAAARSGNRLGLDLWIAGPGTAPPINLQRKIIKGPTYKNWRLDGEVVHNPTDDGERFNMLSAGDLALFAFEGDLAPEILTLVLLARSAPSDRSLLNRLDERLGGQSMRELEEEVLREACRDHPPEHPVWLLLADDDVEGASIGLAPAVSRLLTRPRTRAVSLEELRRARRSAEEIGQIGERLVDSYLDRQRTAGIVEEYEWTSGINAISPWDFRVRRSGTWEKLEVKTTARDFAREYHLPLSELREAAHGEGSFRIGRVYFATRPDARMRVSRTLRSFAESILRVFEALPEGVTPDAVTVVPDDAMFKEEIVLAGPAAERE